MIVTFGRKRHAVARKADPDRWITCRELDARQSCGLTVRLLWDGRRDRVLVHVRPAGDGAEFVLNPPKSMARYAFEHPFGVAHLFAVTPGLRIRPLAA